MSKYAGLIQEARKQTNDKTSEKSSVIVEKKSVNNKNSSPSQKARKPESQKARKQVNLSIKVNESDRRHWVSEAKRQGTSLTSIIIESLTKKFGQSDE